MKTTLKTLALPSLAAACALAAGCAAPAQTRAIRSAADSGLIQDLNETSQFAFSVPNAHSGAFSSIGRFNATIEKGPRQGQPVTFVLGQSRATRQWEVLRVLVQENGQWKTLPMRED